MQLEFCIHGILFSNVTLLSIVALKFELLNSLSLLFVTFLTHKNEKLSSYYR